MRGLLITLEGIDGSGKSTVSRLLAPMLEAAHPDRSFIFTSEPTGGEAGRILREVHLRGGHAEEGEASRARRMEEMFLFAADHADHLASRVIPALEAGSAVISDRYADSTAAYQGVTLAGIVPDPVTWIREVIRPWNVVPDMTIIFALDPEEALERIRSRPGLEKFESLHFLRKVDANFRRLAGLEPERFVIIDACGPAEDVAARAFSAISELIRRG